MLPANAGHEQKQQHRRHEGHHGQRGHENGGLPGDVLRARDGPRQVQLQRVRANVVGDQARAHIHGDEEDERLLLVEEVAEHPRRELASMPICDMPGTFAAAQICTPRTTTGIHARIIRNRNARFLTSERKPLAAMTAHAPPRRSTPPSRRRYRSRWIGI